MPRIPIVRSLALLACLSAEGATWAQSIDPASARLALHQPFALRLLVRTESSMTDARAAACIDADFQSGHTHLVSDHMQVSLTPSERPGWHEVLFRHPHVVDERVVLARIALRCPARFEREFVLEAIPGVPPEAGSAHAPPTTTRSTAVTAARTGVAARPARQQPAAANATVDTPTKADPVAAVTARSSPRPAAPPHPMQHQDARDTEQLALQAENRRLRRELAQARQSTPPASTSRPAGGDPSWQHAAALGLALPLLGLLPLWRRWRGSLLPHIKTMEISQPSPPRDPSPWLNAPATEVAPAPATAARPFAPEATRVTVSAPTPTAPVVSPIGELSTALIPPTVIPAGGASLADPDAAVFTCQVDKLVQDGYVGVAVNLLEKSLDAGPAKNPWLLLQLLALYERLGQRGDAARLISQLQTLYRVHLPMVGGQHLCGKALLDQPELLAEVSEAWRSPDLVQQLEEWLLATTGPTWDLATFEDLLLLHAIARNRPDSAPVTTPDPAPRLEHVLEWTFDDH